MLLKIVPAAILAAALSVSMVQAQSRQPAELPPAGFAGQQYVDSRGCLFVRAGLGGQVNWVARVDHTRRQVCGMTPTPQTMAAAQRCLADGDTAAAPVVAPAPALPPPRAENAPRRAAAAPAPAITTALPPPPTPTPAQTTGAQAVAAPTPKVTHATAGVTRFRGCPEHAPYGRRLTYTDGRTALFCSANPGSLPTVVDGYVNPATNTRITAATGSGHAKGSDRNTPINYAPQFRDQAIATAPPAGYRAAWDDDRLNPNRARGTVGGHQDMKALWSTDQVPQVQTGTTPHRAIAPTTRARFVQVGSFAVPANAQRAAARLQSLGMPVNLARGSLRGKPIEVVRAGPFMSEQHARAALGQLRSAGYHDAILR